MFDIVNGNGYIVQFFKKIFMANYAILQQLKIILIVISWLALKIFLKIGQFFNCNYMVAYKDPFKN